MSRRKALTKAVSTVIWEYQYDAGTSGSGPFWIVEDDERSASWKAHGDGGTGRIRSYTKTVTTTEPVMSDPLPKAGLGADG
ncbi:hypothetical protein [Curtobacterium sp. MCBD17_040]|uniref:hypothetical protein n=1 Tax=Curtobacterium sp. MCBD17_040 TaxID=2175674 RepID=UPI000DA80D2B|nr:hypothetical protein [Curtobacterium sp. MCBD17_040]WIB65367.1 hypothetical protein DEI94_18340 [Curtobacterium sp. MCBD17_040]